MLADRLMELAAEAMTGQAANVSAGYSGKPRTQTEKLALLALDATAGKRRGDALSILVGLDGAERALGPAKGSDPDMPSLGSGILKTWPASLIPEAIRTAMAAAKASAEMLEAATAMDIDRAAARAEAVAKGARTGDIEAKAAAKAKYDAIERAGWVRTTTESPPSATAGVPQLMRDPDALDDADPLRSILTIDVEEPDDLPEPALFTPKPARRDGEGGPNA